MSQRWSPNPTRALDRGAVRQLPGTHVLRSGWVRWSLLAMGAVAVAVEVTVTLAVERAPAGLAWALSSAAPIVVAVVVIRRRPDHPSAGWLALSGSAGSLTQLTTTLIGGLVLPDASTSAAAGLYLLNQTLSIVASASLAMVLGLFADGLVRRRYEGRALSALWLLLLVPPLVVAACRR